MTTYKATIGSTTENGATTIYHGSITTRPFMFFNCEVTEGRDERIFRDDKGNEVHMDEIAEPGMAQAMAEFVNTFAWHRERFIHKSYDEVGASEADDAAADAAGHATITIANGEFEVEIESY